jgi:hypothetical protein
MESFRALKRRSRRHVHDRMKVPALYIASTGANPVPINVRIHRGFDKSGDIGGRNNDWMSREDIKDPALVFMLDEVATAGITLARPAVISVQDGEAYQIDRMEPADDITVTAKVTRLELADTIDLPVPEIVP